MPKIENEDEGQTFTRKLRWGGRPSIASSAPVGTGVSAYYLRTLDFMKLVWPHQVPVQV